MATPFIDFRPAEVRKNKETYILYYVLDPTTDRLKRMRVRCNRVKSPGERKRYTALLCAEINRKLYNGWNPLIGEEAATKRVSIVEAATDPRGAGDTPHNAREVPAAKGRRRKMLHVSSLYAELCPIVFNHQIFLIFAPQNNRQCTTADHTVLCSP